MTQDEAQNLGDKIVEILIFAYFLLYFSSKWTRHTIRLLEVEQ